MSLKATKCPFCDLRERALMWSNDLAVAFADGYPVSPGHTLIIPRRHVGTYFDAGAWEQQAIWEGVAAVKKLLDDQTPRPDGYNIGINVGAAAGQTVMHLHVHVIPRYNGDMPDPRGGVRGVIPGKQKYGGDPGAAAKPDSADPVADLPRFVTRDRGAHRAALSLSVWQWNVARESEYSCPISS